MPASAAVAAAVTALAAPVPHPSAFSCSAAVSACSGHPGTCSFKRHSLVDPHKGRVRVSPLAFFVPLNVTLCLPLPLRQISCHCPFKCPFVTFSAFVPLKFPPVFVSLKLRFPFVHLNIRLLSLSIGELFLMATPLFRTHFEQCSLNYFCRRPKG